MAAAIPYDEEIADRVCDAIATQSKGLGDIITELKLGISPALIYKWIQQDEGFRERYTRAKADQVRILAEEIKDIADEQDMGEIITEKPYTFEGAVIKEGGKPVILTEIKRADMLEHRKLRIESRKWLAAKLLPKVYGDKLGLTGADGEGPVEIIKRVVTDV